MDGQAFGSPRRPLSRRDFLRYVGLVSGGLSLVFLAACSQQAQPVSSPPAAPSPTAPTVAQAVPSPTAPTTAPTVAQAAKKQIAPGFVVDSALFEAARKEGTVVFWGGLQEEEVKEFATKFQELTGIKVEATRLSAGPQYTRLNKERESNLFTVDVISHGDVGLWVDYKTKRQIVPYVPEAVKQYADQFKDRDGYFAAVALLGMPIGYNTKIVTGADIPKRYADLADPKYKGKVATAHGKHSGTGNELIMMLSDKLGWRYYEQLKANGVFLVRSQFEMNPLLESGERPLGLGAIESSLLVLKAQGKPVDIVYPEEGMAAAWHAAGLVDRAPHPNAGKLFLEFLHGPAGQSLVAKWYYLSPLPGVAYPPGRKSFQELKVMALTAEEVAKRSQETRDRFSDLFGG